MRDLIGLIEAICDAYDRSDLQPSGGTTWCNVAVDAVATAMGCKELGGKMADEIVAFIAGSPDWSEVAFDKAQELANGGSLLIAGLDSKTLNQAHGHVVVIRPGKPCYSGKWGKCPRILNIGKNNFIARAKHGPLTNQPVGLNEAFVTMPKIFVWRVSL